MDCATLLTPDVVIDRCRAAGIPHRADRHRSRHGNRNPQGRPGRKSPPWRRDVATDGAPRHHRLRQRLARGCRRGAISRSTRSMPIPKTLAIEDYFGGLADPCRAAGALSIGSARARIAEDHLRILRYYRLSGAVRIGTGCRGRSRPAPGWHTTLKGLSRERIAAELLALLALPDPHPVLERMRSGGVLGVILPEGLRGAACCSPRTPDRCRNRAMALLPIPSAALPRVLPPSPDVAEVVAARLRLFQGPTQPAHRRCLRRTRAGQRKPRAPSPNRLTHALCAIGPAAAAGLRCAGAGRMGDTGVSAERVGANRGARRDRRASGCPHPAGGRETLGGRGLSRPGADRGNA